MDEARTRRVHKRHSTLNRSLGGDIFINGLLIVFGAFMALPLIYTVSSALKPPDELWVFPPRFLTYNPTLRNFKDMVRLMSGTMVPFTRYIFNTVFVSVIGTAGHVVISSLAAFCFAKYRFPFSRFLFNMVVLALMFNTTVTAIPNFLIMSRLNLIDSYWSLILPAFAAPLGLYLMKQFMEQMVPGTILEAASIDGASYWKCFWRLAMPMVKPAWLTLIIFSFQGLWNLGASSYIQSEQLKTFNYALSQILAGGLRRAGAGAAALVIMMIVPLTIFLFTQSSIIETMATSGMKD